MREPEQLGRRRVIELIAAAVTLGFGASCAENDATRAPEIALPAQSPGGAVPARGPYADAVDALVELILPAERDDRGAIVVAGARECRVDDVLRIDDFAALAAVQGLVPPLPSDLEARLTGAPASLRSVMNTALDALASRHRPLQRFEDLPRDLQDAVVVEGFDDPAQRPLFQLVRAACFLAYLGGVTSDAGLRAVGFPAFDDLPNGLAVSGYPRTRDGKLLDPAEDDLVRLASRGELDDFTYNKEPPGTPGDPLATALDANGDLP